MARNPKQDANLKPIQKGDLSKEELKKRQSNGGKKSGESRRKKRDARQAMRYILGLPVTADVREQMKKSSNAKATDDLTNMEALQARLFTRALSGDLAAYEMVMKIAGYEPEEIRKERESVNADKRRDIETQFKMDTMASRGIDSANVAVNMTNEDGASDVVIYLPKVGEVDDLEVPDDDDEEIEGEGE